MGSGTGEWGGRECEECRDFKGVGWQGRGQERDEGLAQRGGPGLRSQLRTTEEGPLAET